MHPERERDTDKRKQHDFFHFAHYQGARQQSAEQVGNHHCALDLHILQARNVPIGNRIGNRSDQLRERRREHNGGQTECLTDDGLQPHCYGKQKDLQMI